MSENKNPRKRLGDFEIIRELGRGGMGIVYEARQVSLNRKVALKVISGSLGLSSKAVLRFQREAEAAGRLHHTNIVPIYATGNDDGAHYYAMELIDGPSLHQVIRSLRSGDRKSAPVSDSAATMAVGPAPAVSTGESELQSSGAVEAPAWVSEILGSPPVSGESTPPPKSNTAAGSTRSPSSGSHLSSSYFYFDCIATMIAGVAEALDYAHENGVIHRDIKPANLLLSRDGRVSINDFGLARMLEQPGMTMSGEFVGSPLYMSPEQITAGRAPLDHRTDVYSLGATLYELLTLKPVFPGQSRDEVIAQILHKEPERPRRQNPKVPVDLETVCLKAMEKDPDRRYQSAGQLAEDLRRFVSRHAISARRVGPLERAVRWARKNKAVAAMACFTLLVTVVAAISVYVLERARDRIAARDNALFAALSGDSTTAVLEIRKAGRLGARSSWVDMILGQVDMFEGKSRDALAKFKSAVEDDPGSLMARAMLTASYMANGLWDSYVREVDALESLAETKDDLSSFDHLFLGIALLSIDPGKSLEAIEKATDRGSSTLAEVWRAHVRAIVAQIRGDKKKLLDALADFEYLRRNKPDLEANPLFNDGQLNARLAASRLCLQEEDREEATRFLREAGSNVQHLASFPSFLTGNFRRLHYYEFTRDLDSMTAVMEVVAASQGRGYLVGPYGAAFFGLGRERVDEALAQLEGLRDRRDSWATWTRVMLLSETLAGRREADKLLDGFLSHHPRDSEAVEDVFSVLFLRGQREDAIAYVRDRSTNLRQKAWKYLAINRKALEYLSGGLPEEDLRRFATSKPGVGPYVFFAIGLRHLIEGNRSTARINFERSGASAFYSHSMSTWSRAFAARMSEDETWPEWLPAEPVDSAAK